MQILWPSRVCDCSFVLEFDPTRDPLTRPYRVVGWGPDEEEIESPYANYPAVTEVRKRDACPTHDDDDAEGAFKRVLLAHIEAGYGEDYRKITVIGWTALCGCLVTRQEHSEEVNGENRIIGPTLRRCDTHLHLEGADVFHQVRRESVEMSRAYDAIRDVCAPAVEPAWTTPDGRKIWQRDVDLATAKTVRLILGDPASDLREHPEVSVRAGDRMVEVVLPRSLVEYAAQIQDRIPESIVRVR